ncbi:hypothetical protein [Streptomyces sp. S-2]|uniref:hypothetical protein n=1 Tax=Streptomyces sp. S-2 TaxID=2675217 RepID=UPI001436A6D7|nr:hypothetical protein [Streptomyces sp. S-2]MBV7254074.1 hypothetical protein [Streptomyces sp. S-2]
MRGKKSLPLVVLLLVLTAGCAGGTGEHAAGSGTRARELTLAEEAAIDRAEDTLVGACMRREGFRYWPGPVPGVAERKAGRYVVDDVDWARRYGYGRSFDLAAEKARVGHPNVTYANALPARERVRYSHALDGDLDDAVTVSLPSGGTVATPRTGCYAEARTRLYGDHAAWFRARKTVTSLTPLYVPRIFKDARQSTAVAAWSRCMKEAGRPFASPDEIRRERDGLVEGMSRAEALRTESALAVTEAECARETSLGETARALETEYRAEALRPYAEESTAYRRMRLAALARAREL